MGNRSKNKCFLITFLSTILFSTLSFSQHPQPIFRHYTAEDGLPSSEVYHAMQDSKGYIWFATDMGVARFDGYKFQNFSLKDGLPDMTVFNIFEDYKGRIWFATYSGKLAYYHKNNIYQYKYNDELQKHFKILYKSSFYVDGEDNVYISVYGQGYFKVSKAGKITQYNNSETDGYQIVQIDSSKVLLSMYGELELQDILSIQPDDFIIDIHRSASDKNARCIKYRNNVILFALMEELIEVRDSTDFSKYSFEHNAISLMEDKNENVWLGTFEGGVLFYENGIFSKPARTYLKGLSVTSVMNDAEGGYWFTTLENGVYYIPSNEFLTFSKSTGLPDDRFSSVTSDGRNTVFAGIDKGTLYGVNDRLIHEIKTSLNLPTPSYINALFFDQADNLLHVGTSGVSYYFFNTKSLKGSVTLNSIATYDIIKRKDSSIWTGGMRGIRKLIKKEWVHPIDLKEIGTRISALYDDSNGDLWIGTLQGLGKLDNNQWIFLGNKNKLFKTRVTDIAETPSNMLCVATRGAGIIFLDNDTVRQINSSNGLTSDNVNHIFIDKNAIWLSTDKGLNKITFVNYGRFHYEIETITTLDGLASNEVNQVTKIGDEIWVATNKGLTFFNPQKAKPNTSLPPIYITKVNIAEKDTAILDQYKLDYDQNRVVISYIGLSYKNPNKLQYAYKMQGVDSMWSYTDITSVQYTTLPHGDYVFLVKAINEDGYQSTSPATINFSIAPPFWETAWLKLLCLMAAIGAVYAFFKIRILTYNKDVVRELMVLLLNKMKRTKFLVVKTPTTLVKIDSKKILWIQASDNYVEVVTNKKAELIRDTMNSIYKKLPVPQEFIRIHRSYIVRIDKITAINTESVKIEGRKISVGQTYRDELATVKKQLSL
ncbi:MAG: hypothetical protein COA57_16275 [Flavobacteriales bacterium]|nr:MAG: hypothetical protein COA57_16275 [Flavobacteriales bacterium]